MLATAGVALAGTTSTASAQYYWVNTNGNWSVTSNWGEDDNGVPLAPPPAGGNTVSLEFYTDNSAGASPPFIGSYTSTNNLANPFTLNSLNFFNFAPSGDITVAGNALRFAGTDSSINMQWFDGNARISAPLQLSVNTTIDSSTFTGTQLLLSGNISGAGGLAINSGSVYLTGTNTYTGLTTFGEGGSLYAAANNTLSPNSTIELSGLDQLFFEVPAPVAIAGVTLATGAHSQVIGALSGTGLIDISTASLTLGGNNASTTFSGTLLGDAGSVLNKVGAGSMLVNGTVGVEQLNITGGSIIVGSEFGLATTDINVAVNNGLAFTGFTDFAIGALSGSGNLDISGVALSTGIGGESTYSGLLSGSGTLVKLGAGTLVLTNTNTYTGGTQVDAGTVRVATDRGLGATNSPITFSGGAIQLAASFDFAPTRAITLNGSGVIDTQGFNTRIAQSITETDLASILRKRGTGTLTLGGSNAFSGGVQLEQGSLVLTNNNAAGTAGAIEINSPDTGAVPTALSVAPNITLARDITVNNFSTGTTITALAGNSGPTIFSGNVTLNKDITLVASNTTALDSAHNPGQTRFDGQIAGTGGMTIVGGNMVQYRGGAKTYTGITHLTGSGTTLSIKEASASPSNSTIDLPANTTLVFEGVGNAVVGGLNGSGSVINNDSAGVSSIKVGNNNQSTIFNGVINNGIALEKVGAGTLTLTGNNPYSGPTTFTAGVVSVAASNDIGNGTPGNGLIFNGGTLRTTGLITTGRSLTVNSTGGTLDTSNQTVTINGTAGTNFSGNLNITGGGSLVLARTSGPLTINPGATATVSNGASLVVSSNIEALSAGGNRLAVVNNSTAGFRVTAGTHNAGSITGTGNTQIDAGAALIADHVRQGILTVSGLVRVRPNGTATSASRLTDLSFTGNGTLDLNDNDLIIDYAATGPNPMVKLQNWVLQGYADSPTAGKTGIISTTGQSAGNTMLALFDNAITGLPSFDGQTVDATTIIGKYTYQGDINLDGQVDGSDLSIVFSNLGATVQPGNAWLLGDTNIDGIITPDDLMAIDANFGRGIGNPLAAQGIIAAVPEPTGLTLVATAGLLALRRRRKSQI
jgi:autotransporter-associated beta strand protein